jgi:hypothetical protein
LDRACCSHGIEHRLTKPNHPWNTDVVDKSLLDIFSCCARTIAWQRAGASLTAQHTYRSTLLRQPCAPSSYTPPSARHAIDFVTVISMSACVRVASAASSGGFLILFVLLLPVILYFFWFLFIDFGKVGFGFLMGAQELV